MKQFIIALVGMALLSATSVNAQTKASNVPNLSADTDTATASAGAATCNHQLCTVTSEALTTAAAADYTLTLTDTLIDTGSSVFVSITNGTNTTAYAQLYSVAVTADNTAVIKIKNMHASSALNGTLKVTILVL